MRRRDRILHPTIRVGAAVGRAPVPWRKKANEHPGRFRVIEPHLRAEPMSRLDNREIVAARFVEPQALLAEDILPPFIRADLDGALP